VYYEFMPVEESGKEHPKMLNLHEVEKGRNYVLGDFHECRALALYYRGHHPFTSLNPYRDPDYRAYETFHQCLRRRGDD
jgi:hypothetical protein